MSYVKDTSRCQSFYLLGGDIFHGVVQLDCFEAYKGKHARQGLSGFAGQQQPALEPC